MSTYQINPIADFRNEGWAITGSGITTLNAAWSSTNDANYASAPANKGRAAVTFPQDIGSIPQGSTITSVTVYVRAESTDTASRTLTVNMLSKDDTTVFTARTVALSNTPTTIEIGSYTTDPLNRNWNKDKLDQLVLQVYSLSTSDGANKVRVYEVYGVVNYSTAPQIAFFSPSGQALTSVPEVEFTYSQADGDIQESVEFKVFTAAQAQDVTFNPDTTPSTYPAPTTYTVKSGDSLFSIAAAKYGDGYLWPSIWAANTIPSGNPNLIDPGLVLTLPGIAKLYGDIGTFKLPFSLGIGDYVIYARVTSEKGAVSDWASRAFSVSTSGTGNPGSPGGSLGGIGTGGGGGFESVIADPQTSNVYLSLRDGSNLLGIQQSDFETVTDSIDWTGTNCTPAQDLTGGAVGTGSSLKLVATASGDMSAVSDWIGVAEGAPLTLRAQVEAATTGRTVTFALAFADDNYAPVAGGSSVSGTDSTSTYTELVLTNLSVPQGASRVQITATVSSAGSGERHNVDRIGLMYGTDSAYSNGGHASRNMLTSAQCNADDPITTEPWTAISGTTYSRVSTLGTGSDGGKAFKALYAGGSSTISYVATGTAYTATDSASTYTLNTPAGIADGDVLVAYVAAESSGTTGVCTQALAPAGWTLVSVSSNGYVSLSVLMRDALAADPSTWTGNLTQGATQVRKRAVVIAYRGAAPVAQQNTGATQTATALTVSPTPSMFNSDSGAWRLSAFAVQDDAAGGTMTANIVSPTIPPIAYVGHGTPTGGRDASSNTYSWNRPANLQTGDLMVAAVFSVNAVTLDAPSGWIKVRGINASNAMAIFVRTATSSEPASWSASTSVGGTPANWVSQCVAYRNCDVASNQFIDEDGAGAYAATISTPIVTNTDAKAWRLCVFGNSSNVGNSWTSNEVIERVDNTNGNSGLNATVAVYDSNGPCSTGSQARIGVATNDQQVNSACAWIGLIKPAVSGGTPGANETERQDVTAGTSSTWLTLAAYDSNGAAATGSTTVYGTFTPGSGTAPLGSASYINFLLPIESSAGEPAVVGEAGITLVDYVDIRNVTADVTNRTGNVVTVLASALGSVNGTSHLKLYAFEGSDQISVQVAQGPQFNTSVWTDGGAQFVLPQGTTRLQLGLSAVGLNVNDYVLFDRICLGFGTFSTYRQGTGSDAHPILDAPLVEYQEDSGLGYGDWQTLVGNGGTPWSYDADTGLCTIVDQTPTPLAARRYRARTQSYGLAGDSFTSDYGPVSDEVTLFPTDWWIKDMTTPEMSMKIKLYMDPDTAGTSGALNVVLAESSQSFLTLGNPKPIVVSDGYKGDTIPVVIQCRSQEFAQLIALFEQHHTLFLQSNIDKAWWVRPFGQITSAVQPTADLSIDPLRFVAVTFLEVEPPE